MDRFPDQRSHLEDLYGIEVSPDLIGRVTDAVLDEVKEWRSRALDAVYPVFGGMIVHWTIP